MIFLALVAALVQEPAPIRMEYGVAMPMRDGVRLVADVWLPRLPGRYPVVLVRTPYQKDGLGMNRWGRYFASRGYAFVIQDTRGRGDSEGTFDPFFGEERDGYDTVEWLASAPWSNGRIGMLGLSYLGSVQWAAARAAPPHLACIAPTAAPGRWFEEIPYQGGAFNQLFALDWLNGTSGRIDQGPNQANVDWDRVLTHRPLLTADSVMGRILPRYREWLANPTTGPYWDRLRFTAADFERIRIPTLTITGWYDGDQAGALYYWRGLMGDAPDRTRHFLVVGPWRHAETIRGASTRIGDTEFPAESHVDIQALHLAFFDWCLRGVARRFEAPRARIWVTGGGGWRSDSIYPPAEARPTHLYLGSGGNANSLDGDGQLRWSRPGASRPDRFVFDPKKPVPGSPDQWGSDRREIQRRPDVLVYTSAPLEKPVVAIGRVEVDLRAASDGFDTDFVAVLTDVHPDGRALSLGPSIGIRRARYRAGYDRQVPLTPGRAATIPIELFDIAHRFEAGHRIRLEITSSAFPHFAPNQNTGRPVASDTVWRTARQTIHHDRANPSALILPIVRSR